MKKLIAVIAISFLFASCKKEDSLQQAASTNGTEEGIIEELASSILEETVSTDTSLLSTLSTTAEIEEEAAIANGILINADMIQQVANYIQQRFASGDLTWAVNSLGGNRNLANVASRRAQDLMRSGSFNSFVQQHRGNVSKRFGQKMHRKGRSFRHSNYRRPGGYGQQRPTQVFARQGLASQRFNSSAEEECLSETVVEAMATRADVDANNTLSTTELAAFRVELQSTAESCVAAHKAEKDARRAAFIEANGTPAVNSERAQRIKSHAQARMFSKVRHTVMTVHSVLADKVEETELRTFMESLRQEVQAKMEARRAEMEADVATEL